MVILYLHGVDPLLGIQESWQCAEVSPQKIVLRTLLLVHHCQCSHISSRDQKEVEELSKFTDDHNWRTS